MSPVIITLLVLVGVGLLLAIWLMGIYNGLVVARNRFKNAFAQIDVQLKRRYELTAKEGIRANTVAPGVVDTPLHKDNPKEFLKTLSPMPGVSTVQEIVDAVLFLTEAPRITGEALHVDGGAHLGRW